MRAAILSLSVALLAGACGGDEGRLESGFATGLSGAQGCCSYFVLGDATESTIMVFKPTATYEERTYEFGGTDTGAILYVETGENLISGFCGDTSGQTSRRYHAIDGTATTTVTANGSDFDVQLSLSGVVFGEEFGDQRITVQSFAASATVTTACN